MSVYDTGTYTRGGFPSTDFRDFIVWPPGWEPPAVTESVILGAAITVPATGLRVAGYTTSVGELWTAYTSATWSRRIGFIAGTAAGSYIIGDSVPITRFPRFPVPHRPVRGPAPGSFYPSTLPPGSPKNYPGLVLRTASRTRAANVATLALGAVHGLQAGKSVAISGVSGIGYNGDYILLSVTAASITYQSVGPDEASTADVAGYVVSAPQDFVRRLHQFGGLTPWIRVTGPAVSTGSAGTGTSTAGPYDSLTWNRDGVQLRMVLFNGLPMVDGQGDSYFSAVTRVWAPVAAEQTPDFSVDADIPDYSTIRIIWVSGGPVLSHPSDGTTPPYVGATRLGRRRSQIDIVGSYDQVPVAIRIPEDNGRVESIQSLATPVNTWPGPASLPNGAVRASLFPTLRVGKRVHLFFPATDSFTNLEGQWFRRRVNGTSVALGSPVSLAYILNTVVAAPSTAVYAADTIAPPVDPAWLDAPGMYFLRLTTYFVSSGTPFTQTFDVFPEGNASNANGVQPDAGFPPLVPWPFDVPRFPFAADESDVRYVTHPGWRLAPVTLPTLTATSPIVTRAGTTISSVAGSIAVSPTEDGAQTGDRACVLRAIAKAVDAGDLRGSNSTAAAVTVTVAAFASQTVDAEGVDVWSTTGSHVGYLSGLTEKTPGETVVNLP